VENDANAAAWGEFTFGAGEDVEDLLMLTVGTGVGGGSVIDGELFRGGFGMGGEVGHITMVPEGVPCPCGNLGCLESYGSGSALVRISRELAGSDPDSAKELVERAGGDPARITGPLVTEAAQDGNTFAIARLAELGDWLGQGVATLTAVLDPNVVVIGGGVSEAGDLLLDPIRDSFERHVTGRGHRPILEIRQAQLGNAGGMIGVADLARHR
jgi:glucokinase